MRDHTKLRAFELADDIAMLIYQATRGFPKEEICGLTSQMRRSAVSIPANIGVHFGCIKYGRRLRTDRQNAEKTHGKKKRLIDDPRPCPGCRLPAAGCGL